MNNEIKLVACIIFFMLSIIDYGHAQVRKDTVYIQFDSIHPNMKKYKTDIKVYDEKKNIKEKLVISYKIQEKLVVKKNRYVGYWFTFSYSERTKAEISLFGGTSSKSIIKPIRYLNNIKLLDYNYFEDTDYQKVCKTFEAEDSWEQDVVIFIVDKEEIKNDMIVLREVAFKRPVIE